MGVGADSYFLGDLLGRCCYEANNHLWTLVPWFGLACDLGGIFHGERFNAEWSYLGYFIDHCLVVDRWGVERGSRSGMIDII